MDSTQSGPERVESISNPLTPAAVLVQTHVTVNQVEAPMKKRTQLSDGVNPMPAVEPGTKPLDIIQKAIEHWLDQYARARLVAKDRAARVMLVTSILSGVISVLGAINVALADNVLAIAFSALTTVCAATSGILVAWNEHFRHRDLWIIRSTTVFDLDRLQTEFTMAREDGTAEPEYFHQKLNAVLDDALKAWLDLHGARRLPTHDN